MRRSRQRRCPQALPAHPHQPSLHRADPSSRSLIPRCGNRTLEQVVTPARCLHQAALETSATSVTKPCHPPRPHGEHGKHSPPSFHLPSLTPTCSPRTHPPEASKTPFSLFECPSRFFLGTHQQATEGPVGRRGRQGLSAGHRAPSNPQNLPGRLKTPAGTQAH